MKKTILKRIICISLSLALGLSNILIANAESSVNLVNDVTMQIKTTDVNEVQQFDDSTGTNESIQSGIEIAIFLAGILVGYIVDGYVVNLTGNSSAEWISIALDYFSGHPDVSSIHIDSDGTVHGGGGGSW